MAAPLRTTPVRPLLATTVVGSYSVPEWLDRLNTDFYRGRISRAQIDEIHETVIKAAIKDQEQAGIDIISDGELRRDNDIDYLLARIPEIQITGDGKARHYFDYYEARLAAPLRGAGRASLGLAGDFRFTTAQTDRPVKFSFTGPLSLSRRMRNDAYATDAELVLALADLLNSEARSVVEAGARYLQIDEPFLAGYPELIDLAMEAIRRVTRGVEATWMVHVCWGNRYARPLWQGHYDFLFPQILSAPIDQLVLEFARTGDDDLALIAKAQPDFMIGLGVIDVKTSTVETPELVAHRIRRALTHLPAEQLMINPDCGLRHLPRHVVDAKLRAMVAGAAVVRDELAAHPAPSTAKDQP